MKLSVIIPAYNEEKRIEECLRCVFAALRANARPDFWSEIIVVDNNSTDATGRLARQAGAKLLFEPVNQISRARNKGATVATGDWLLFVDADTIVSAETLGETLELMQSGRCVGGATVLKFDRLSTVAKYATVLGNRIIRWLKLTCGCYVFCCADAFRDIGGFHHEMFAAEDAQLGKAMKRWGKSRGLPVAIIHRHPPVTSIRKLELYGWTEVGKLIFRFLLFPKRTTRKKVYLRLFYDGRR